MLYPVQQVWKFPQEISWSQNPACLTSSSHWGQIVKTWRATLKRLDFIQEKTRGGWWKPLIPGMDSSKSGLYENSLTIGKQRRGTGEREWHIGNGERGYVWTSLGRGTWACGSRRVREMPAESFLRVSTQLTRRRELPLRGLEKSGGAVGSWCRVVWPSDVLITSTEVFEDFMYWIMYQNVRSKYYSFHICILVT